MKCKHCGADNFNESKFCFQCGQELSSDDVQHSEDPPVDPTHPICKNCGASNTADAKFCHQCGQELSSKAEDPEQKSDDDLGKDALAFGAGLLDESAAKTRNDTVCPFCGEPACHPLQKNETTVTNKSYGWGSGCCGMLLLGPFGLLCGLCGKGSKVESKSELWWVCKKCGKAHIALVDALKKWEIATDGIYGSAVAAAIVCRINQYQK
jgi:ribosomal protein L40E